MPMRFELGLESGDTQQGLWMPMPPAPGDPARRGSAGSAIIARLTEDARPEDAIAQLKPIDHRFPESYPKDAEGLEFIAQSPGLWIAADIRNALILIQCAIGFVLLIVSVNISALLVARASGRHREFAIRRALGASRQRIVRQLMTESVVLASTAGVLGLLFSGWALDIVRAIAPPGTPRVDQIIVDGNVLWCTAGVSLLSAVLFGLLPAIQSSSRPIGEGLIPAGARPRRSLRTGLLITEVGLATILVVGGALVVRSFDKLMRLETGVDADRVLTATLQLSQATCSTSAGAARTSCMLAAERVLESVNSLPGIERAALSIGGPLTAGFDRRSGILLERSMVEQPFDGMGRRTTPGFFQVAGIRMMAGRDFESSDTDNAAIVSETFARRYFAGDPLGKRFSTYKDDAGRPVWLEIIGEVNDTRDRAVSGGQSPAVYYQPFTFANGRWQVVARTSVDPLTVAAGLEAVIRSVDRQAEIISVKTLADLLYESVGKSRFHAALFGSFGILALLLAAIGTYGVTAYSVVQRTQEIGIRMALGASAADVMRLIVGHGSVVALAGIAAGLACAAGLTRFLESMLFDVMPTDTATFAGVAVLLFVASLAACYIPARRAMRVDLLTTLRHD